MDVHAVADELQPLLDEVIDLALVSKQGRWRLMGPVFCPLRAELDELSVDALGWADGLAQRLGAIGVPPDGRTITVARQTPFRGCPSGFVDETQVLAELFARVNEIIDKCPSRIDRVGQNDPVSEVLLLDATAGLVKHRWVLGSQQPSRRTSLP